MHTSESLKAALAEAHDRYLAEVAYIPEVRDLAWWARHFALEFAVIASGIAMIDSTLKDVYGLNAGMVVEFVDADRFQARLHVNVRTPGKDVWTLKWRLDEGWLTSDSHHRHSTYSATRGEREGKIGDQRAFVEHVQHVVVHHFKECPPLAKSAARY